MALVLADRVRQTTTTTGQGTITLNGTVTGFQSFSAIGNGNTTYYAIVGQNSSEWEVGIGTYTSSGTTLSRDTVLSSSAGGTTKTTFSAGTKDVFVTYPASKSVYYEQAGGVVIADASTNNALRITQTGSGNALVVEDSTNPDSTPFVIDASGRIIEGYTTTTNVLDPGGVSRTPTVQIHGLNTSTAGQSINNWATSASSYSVVYLSKSKSGVVGTQGVVASGDTLGDIQFSGDDGTNFVPAARIFAAVDGTPGTNDMPGRLVFSTTADGSATPTERMRITSSGNVGIGTSSPTTYANSMGPVLVVGTGNNWATVQGRTDGPSGSTNCVSFGGSYSTNAINGSRITLNAEGSSGQRGSISFWTKPTDDNTNQPTERARIDQSGNLLFNSGYGSVATAYGCRAWVNFNGTGTVAIRASGNVSSITDNGTGDYTINLTTAMPDTNYNVVVSPSDASSGTNLVIADVSDTRAKTTSSFSVWSAYGGNGSNKTLYDVVTINASIFR